MSDTMLDHLHDPAGCEHHWQPVSMVFETQLLDRDGRVVVRQPDLEEGRCYVVCLHCAQHTYVRTNNVGYQLEGSMHRGFSYEASSSHPYSTDQGRTWHQERPEPIEDYYPHTQPEQAQ